MSILILAIISFLLAFLPFFKTMIATIFLSVCTIILSIVYQKKQLKDKSIKKKNEIPTIASFIAIGAIVFSIVNYNMLPAEEPSDNVIAQRIEEYQEYNIENEAIVNNKLSIKVNEITNDGNDYLVSVKVTGIAEESKLLLNNFFIFNTKDSSVTFADYSANKEITYYNEIIKDEVMEDVIVFKLKDIENTQDLYLIYREDVSGVKIKL